MAAMLAHRLTTIAAVAIGTATLGLGGLATAGTAAASRADDAFITRMTAVGVSFPSPQEAVRAGRQVCTDLRAGKAESDIALQLRDQRNLTPQQAAYFVVDASNIYCRRFASQLT
jgi:hypothetical protein